MSALVNTLGVADLSRALAAREVSSVEVTQALLAGMQTHAGLGAFLASDPEAARLLAEFGALLEIPNAGGRYSTKILPDPSRLACLLYTSRCV